MGRLMRLQAEIAAAEGRAWAWGVHDCVTFATRAAGVSTPWRWGSAREAACLLRRLGGMRAGAVSLLGAPRPAALCAPGDLVLRDGALGVAVDHRAVFAAPVGVAFVPLRDCNVGWRV